MSTPLDTLKKLSPRAVVGLRAAGINTLEAAAAMTDDELLGVKGVAVASIQRIRAWAADPTAPEADSAGPGDRERQDRIWELYRAMVAQGAGTESAWNRAQAGVAEFYRRQAEGQP